MHRANNVILEPAHPRIAGALVVIGRSVADLFEPASLHLWAHRAFWTLLTAAAIGLLWLRADGVL